MIPQSNLGGRKKTGSPFKNAPQQCGGATWILTPYLKMMTINLIFV
jgi:hypothetical protein